jgi:hypothetical protein
MGVQFLAGSPFVSIVPLMPLINDGQYTAHVLYHAGPEALRS